jgi:hypothetical protein
LNNYPRSVVLSDKYGSKSNPLILSLSLDLFDLLVDGTGHVFPPCHLHHGVGDLGDVSNIVSAACSKLSTDFKDPKQTLQEGYYLPLTAITFSLRSTGHSTQSGAWRYESSVMRAISSPGSTGSLQLPQMPL